MFREPCRTVMNLSWGIQILCADTKETMMVVKGKGTTGTLIRNGESDNGRTKI